MPEAPQQQTIWPFEGRQVAGNAGSTLTVELWVQCLKARPSGSGIEAHAVSHKTYVQLRQFNFGMNTHPLAMSLPMNLSWKLHSTSAAIHVKQPAPPLPESPLAKSTTSLLNFGSSPSLPSQAIANESTISAFQFGGQAPLPQVGNWTPIPLTAAPNPTTPPAAPSSEPVAYSLKAMPYRERRQTFTNLVGEAERAAIDIVACLQGE
ncbi:uncharacterized protein F5891DRAFT_1193893 [Suillus fuscotomentosus]|uniref:Uncharacterized protein n=1 Tax=Suillus fuscotomentosus TaxID=1912939 RepID=A0AAD4DX11_9AGAM|nr:uncharacterized protein F5891DRAFT_1193893 [Suillus fuscotomentosus]KAG1895718.1 hypothetical protein F5891DRAFT_1193893 [Suillus fuscotomentosus]